MNNKGRRNTMYAIYSDKPRIKKIIRINSAGISFVGGFNNRTTALCLIFLSVLLYTSAPHQISLAFHAPALRPITMPFVHAVIGAINVLALIILVAVLTGFYLEKKKIRVEGTGRLVGALCFSAALITFLIMFISTSTGFMAFLMNGSAIMTHLSPAQRFLIEAIRAAVWTIIIELIIGIPVGALLSWRARKNKSKGMPLWEAREVGFVEDGAAKHTTIIQGDENETNT